MATTTTVATAFPWDTVLALVRWKQTRRGYDNDAQLVQTGFALLAPQSPLLDAAEQAFNVSWHRIVAEAVHFAIFLLTKARRDDAERPEQTTHALRLLRLALTVFAVRKHSEAITIPTNSSNLLLAAMADVLEKATTTQNSGELDVLLDVKHVFLYLFGLPAPSSSTDDSNVTASVASFQLYKPPTNVFAEFMHRTLTASLARLTAVAHDASAIAHHYVALVYAIVGVFQELQRSQMNKKKVFLAIAKTSLRDLIGYRFALTQLASQTRGVVSIVALLDRIVVDALFDSEHIRGFDGALVHQRLWRHANAHGVVDVTQFAGATHGDTNVDDGGVAKKQKKRRQPSGNSAPPTTSTLVSYQKNLFDELQAFLADPSVSLALKRSTGAFVEVLVDAFAQRIRAAAHTKIEDTKTDLKTTKKRAASVIATASTTYSPFKFWAELCAVAFVATQSATEGDAFVLFVQLYESLFRALATSDVYRVTEDTDEREQFVAMETILQTFVARSNTAQRSSMQATPLALVQQQCAIVSSAVACSPNLVNKALGAIFETLGGHITVYKQSSHAIDVDAVLLAGGACVVDLVRSFESMRLLDKFLHAAMTTSEAANASEGLYALFMHPLAEAALRRAFLTLPPGQLDVLWTQFTKQFAATCVRADANGSHENVFALALVRFVFQLFLQEVHVTPQTKTKVTALVTQTYAALFAPVALRLSASSSSSPPTFSASERERLGLFGELLAFYDVLAGVRAEHFDVVLAALKQCSVSSAMQALLALEATTSTPTKQPSKPSKKTKANKTKLTAVVPTLSQHRVDSMGIIKLCIFWLRKATGIRHATASDVANVSTKELARVALLVVDHVLDAKCWDAVAFYLPELLGAVAADKAAELLHALVAAHVREAIDAIVDGPATRIVSEAAFYEIRAFQTVAPAVFAALVSECAAAMSSDTAAAVFERTTRLFAFLTSLPTAYLDAAQCSDLLLNTLLLYKTIAASETSIAQSTTLPAVLAWLETHFKRIAAAVATSSTGAARKRIDAGARLLFARAAADGSAIAAPLLGDILSFYLDDPTASAFVTDLFRSVVVTTTTPRENLLRSALVVEALADLRLRAMKAHTRIVSAAEHMFLASLTASLQSQVALDDATSFVVLGALVKYRAATADVATTQPAKKAKSETPEQRQLQQLYDIVASRLEATLTQATQAVVRESRPHAAWQFYVGFCHHIVAFRSAVTLEMYGRLLAVALALVAMDELADDESTQALRALQALVVHASKDEARLLFATLAREVRAPEPMRAVSALKALCLLLQGERKLSSTRRELLSSHKDTIVAALVENMSRSLTELRVATVSTPLTTTAHAAELCTWTLQVFVLFFSKAELFTWKTHELAHVFVGFQPLLAATADWHAQRFTPAQVHQIWTLSYTLLLRIVRHHFASLVNGTAHIVQATNALLELLVLASRSSSTDTAMSAQCVEWSSNLARLYGYMKEHDGQLRKHVVYLLLAYLLGVTRDNLSIALQQKLRPGVFSLLDICSAYEKEQLYAALDSTGKSLLKSLDTNYKLTHRYVGKV